MIPPFDARGLLPGDCEATPAEIRDSPLVTGTGVTSPGWDRLWREKLADNLERVARMFWEVGGVKELWVNGSFVEDKDRPGDVDLYFTLSDIGAWASGRFQARLNALEGEDLWTWNPARRRRYPGAAIPKPPFWGRYRTDVFPDFGQASGILGPADRMLTFPEAFRLQRGTGRTKGIVKLVPPKGRR